MSPECLFMVYGCLLCALTPRPSMFSFPSYTIFGYYSLFWLLLILYFFCISLVSLTMEPFEGE